jgi:hypothetical protein
MERSASQEAGARGRAPGRVRMDASGMGRAADARRIRIAGDDVLREAAAGRSALSGRARVSP